MHGGGQGFESPQLHFEFKTETSQRLPTDKSTTGPNTPPNGVRDLLEGFILQLRIEGYSPKTINYYHNYAEDFVACLGEAHISTLTPTRGDNLLANCRGSNLPVCLCGGILCQPINCISLWFLPLRMGAGFEIVGWIDRPWGRALSLQHIEIKAGKEVMNG